MPETSRIVFRVAGDSRVGFGHIRRCLTLASHLREKAVNLCFVASSLEGKKVLSRAGFSVEKENGPQGIDRTLSVLTTVSRPSLCILDDPDAGSDQLSALAHRTRVVCIDDTAGRLFPVEMVVNGSAGAQDLSYRGAPHTRYLLGPDYILLRPEFACFPERSDNTKEIRRVFLTLGGGNGGTLFSRLLRVVCRTIPDVCVDLIVGPFGRTPVLDTGGSNRIRVYRDPPNVRSLMLRADVAISAGGQTTYELAATATPTLGVRMVADQKINLQGLASAGTLQNLGSPEEAGFSNRLAEALSYLKNHPEIRRRMGDCGRRLVDGLGTERVAEQIQRYLFHG